MENVQKKMMGLKTLKYPIVLIISLISVFLYSFLAKDSQQIKGNSKNEKVVDLGNTKDLAALPSEKYEVKVSDDSFDNLSKSENNSVHANEGSFGSSGTSSSRDKYYEEYQSEKDKQIESGLAKKKLVTVQRYKEPETVARVNKKSSVVLYRDAKKEVKENDQNDVIRNFDKKINELAKEKNDLSRVQLPFFADVNSYNGLNDFVQPGPKSRFYGIQKKNSQADKLAETKGNKKLILAQTIENKTVLSGQDVRILVREDFVYNGKIFKSGITLSGKANISGNRLMVDFRGLIENGVYYSIDANLFDTDAQLGLNFHIDENDAIKQTNRQSSSSSLLNQVNPLLIYNPTGNIAQQASTQIVGSAINQGLNAASNLVRSKGTIPKVLIKTGQICYLNLK